MRTVTRSQDEVPGENQILSRSRILIQLQKLFPVHFSIDGVTNIQCWLCKSNRVRHILGLISLDLSNISVFTFKRHSVSRGLCFPVLLTKIAGLCNFRPIVTLPPVPTYMVIKNGLCVFGYCFSGQLLQCSFYSLVDGGGLLTFLRPYAHALIFWLYTLWDIIICMISEHLWEEKTQKMHFRVNFSSETNLFP